MAHTCAALVLHCIDFRFVHDLLHYMKANGLDRNYDDVGVAGGVKNLVDPKESSDREFVLRQIEISKQLHAIHKVFLVNHLDCGAYGGRRAFASDAEEVARHRQDLHAARELIRRAHPELEVLSVLARLAADEKTVGFESVAG